MPTYFTVKDRRYELATIDSLNFREALEVKRISGMPMSQVPLAVAESDPDACLAIFVVSIQRVDPAATEAMLMGENPTRILDTVERIEPKADPQPDPQTASPSERGDGAENNPPSTTTPDGSGIPVGSTQT